MKIDKRIIPNAITFTNLCFGMLAIMLAVLDKELLGSCMILAAGFMDRFDGTIARRLNVESDLGRELDSLSDLVSFGLAPSLLAWHLSMQNEGILGIAIAFIFLSAGAYRLAKFNITPFIDNTFTGVPITIAGMLLCLYNIYAMQTNISDSVLSSRVTIFIMLLLSYLMVSTKLKIKKR